MVFAHERQVFEIGDKTYLFVIGSLNEPVFVDDKTGVDLRVKLADPANPGDSSSPNAEPVAGLETSLKVELIAGDKKKTMALAPAYKDPGAYKAEFYPTLATTFTYRVFGMINEVSVDLMFSCNPTGHPATADDTSRVEVSEGVTRILKAGSFGCPKPKAEYGFPEPSASLQELSVKKENRWPMVAAILAGLSLLLSIIAFWKVQ